MGRRILTLICTAAVLAMMLGVIYLSSDASAQAIVGADSVTAGTIELLIERGRVGDIGG